VLGPDSAHAASGGLHNITGTVFVILMENSDWSQIKQNVNAPYLNSLLTHPQASYASAYYNPPQIHPSEPNYIWIEAGSNFGIRSNRDPIYPSNQVRGQNHLVKQLEARGLSWKSYQENISGEDCPLVSRYPYAAKHNPFIFFDDVSEGFRSDSPHCIEHIRPFTEFAGDLTRNTVARYVFITPNLCNDMHDSCAPLRNQIKQGDDLLKNTVSMIVGSQAYQSKGAVIITWDEGSNDSDGPIGLILLSHRAKGGGYNNNIHYTHSSTLRTLQEIFAVTPLLGDAAQATDLSDLFTVFP